MKKEYITPFSQIIRFKEDLMTTEITDSEGQKDPTIPGKGDYDKLKPSFEKDINEKFE